MQKTRARILIVDDNPEALIALEMYLEKYFYEIQTEKNPNLLPQIIRSKSFDVIILDMNFAAGISSGNEGLFWLKEIKKIEPSAAVIFLTAYGDIELAVKGIKLGAFDFITKPWENEKILATVHAAYRWRKSELEIKKLRSKQSHLSDKISEFYPMYRGTSRCITKVYDTINKVAKTDANILITGESGTGKELISREIHKKSKKGIFVSVDISSIPQSLVESELFGYNKGAFTDAKSDKPGRIELASGGTLFLDEIGNIPHSIQSKLLTVVQNREVTRLGSNEVIPVNFRLISATNESLDDLADQGKFRYDLLFRINTIHIELPPLRERKEDIAGFADYFIRKYGKKYAREEIRIHSEALKKLTEGDWPGNIRELENIIEKSVILADGNMIYKNHIKMPIPEEVKKKKKRIFSLEENEKIIIREALKECNGNMSETADRLGITRATLYRKISKYEI